MTRLTEEQIKKINQECNKLLGYTAEQGIYKEPYKIPLGIKEPVLYSRWNSDGMEGGNCWGDDPTPYTNSEPPFHILDLVLAELNPTISYLEYKKIEALCQHSDGTEWDYYGDYDNYKIKYIILEDLYKILE